MLNRDFKEFIELLNKHNVRYLIVGGYALAFHGHPRYTKDLDIWLWVDPSNAKYIIQVLDDFGFGSLNVNEADFVEKGYIIQLGQPPARIDLITSLTGVEFEDCYQRLVEIEVENILIPIINKEDLKVNKKILGRHQDLADLEELEKDNPST